jgi:hypothetical protein
MIGRWPFRVVRLAVVAAIAVIAFPGTMVAADPSVIRQGVAPIDPTWRQDPAFVQAKNEGRIVISSTGQASILTKAPLVAPSIPGSYSLDVSWTNSIAEPAGVGTDDAGNGYTDKNYWNFCGAGATTVALWYWPNSKGAVLYDSGYFTEPKNWGSGWYATTYWTTRVHGRGFIMLAAEEERPTPRIPPGAGTWPYPGIMDWSQAPGSLNYGTPINRIVDALNWEASGHAGILYFYVRVPAPVSSSSLLSYVHSDIGTGHVPVVVDALTWTSSAVHLPNWKSGSLQVNHSVTIVGYNDTTQMYTVMDTCSGACNNTGRGAGTGTISYANLATLVNAESDGDGIVW